MNFPPPTEKQARLIWSAASGVAFATIIALVVGLIWGLGRVLQILSPVLWPIAVAAVLACLLDPLVDWLEQRRIPRTRAIIGVFILALAIVAGLAGSIVPQVVVEAKQLWSKVPDYMEKTGRQVEDLINNPPRLLREFLPSRTRPEQSAEAAATNAPSAEVSTNALATGPGAPTSPLLTLDKETLQSITTWLAKAVPAASRWLFGRVSLVGSVFGVLAGLALVPIYVFYFLQEKSRITAQWRNYLPVRDSKFKDELVFVLNAINEYLIAFFRGQVLVAICDGVLYTIGFVLIGLPYAMLIGVMACVVTIIPYVGAFLTFVTALIIAAVNFGDWQHPLLVVLVFAIVQTLEGFVVQPKIMGDRVGLHPMVIIIALMVGTTLLGGLLGGILAIPLAAALRVIMFHYVWKRRAP